MSSTLSDQVKKFLKEKVFESLVAAFLLGLVVGFYAGRSGSLSESLAYGGESEVVAKGQADNVAQEIGESGEVKVTEAKPSSYLLNPELVEKASVIDQVCVDVAGAVKKPGVYCFDKQPLVIEAVRRAGDFHPQQYSKEYVSRQLNLAAIVEHTGKVYIPSDKEVVCKLENEVKEPYSVHNDDPIVGQKDSGKEDKERSSCVDINNDSLEQLTKLDGVGESTAQKIIDHRPYTSVEGLLDVPGIGEAKLAGFKAGVCAI